MTTVDKQHGLVVSSIIKPTLADVEALSKWEMNFWMLVPQPIASLQGPKHRKDFEEAVRKSRCDLSHLEWVDAQTNAIELSDIGGIDTVQIIRVYHKVSQNKVFKDGKVVRREHGM